MFQKYKSDKPDRDLKLCKDQNINLIPKSSGGDQGAGIEN
jgi:hypothetical protein